MHENALDKKSEAALLLARGLSTDAVGEAIGRDGSTVRRWRQDPAFQGEVNRLRSDLLGQTAGALVDAASEAVNTLRLNLGAENPQVQVRAAIAILSAVVTVREVTDLEQRIADLEAAAQKEGPLS